MADRNLLARATEGTDAPTPGYIYVDLAKAATSNPTACMEMAQYLTRRLQNKQNPNIKYKCCKVIAKLCESVPRNQFRRCLAQDPSAVGSVKEAMAFRGPMDPVQGDTKNERVRQAAKEALDAVYSEAPTSETAVAYGTGGGVSTSYGPSPHSGGGGYSGGGGGAGMGAPMGGRKMEGIGNPMFADPRLDPRYNGSGGPTSVKDIVREAGDVVLGMIKDPLARNIDLGPQNRVGNLPGYGNSSYGRPPPGSAELARQTGGQWTMASNRGPGAVTSDDYYKTRDSSYQWAQRTGGSAVSASSGSVGGSWASAAANAVGSVAGMQREPDHSRPTITIHSTGGPSGSGGYAASDGTYEKNLILELCPPGGMKPVPPPDKLATFSRTVASLNPDLICPVLLDCIEEGQPWVIRAKALWVMETCVQSGATPDGRNAYLDFFFACQEEILPLAAHPRQAIKEPARRLLQLLGVQEPASSAPVDAHAAAAPVAAPAPVVAPNLLDFGDDAVVAPSLTQAPPPPPSQPPPPPPVQAPPAPPSNMNNSSLFGGMQVKSTAATPSTSHVNHVEAPAPAPIAPQNLLDFDDSAAPKTTAQGNSNDIFRDMGVKENDPRDMFSQLNIKEEDKKTDSDDAGDAAVNFSNGGGSAFGFINSGESSGNSHDNHAPTKESFDPLKNLTPQTADQRKMMTLSPEQMQAIAYQQMMMQQQMQYMQAAMAMQQGRAPGLHPPVPMYPNIGAAGLSHMAMAGKMPMTSHPGNATTSSFSFVDTKPVKKDDKKFDFVKDAMQFESGSKKK